MTTTELRKPPHTTYKAHGGGTGGGVGGALAILLIYALELDPMLEGALGIVITFVGGWLGAYFAPRNVVAEP